MLVSKVFHNNYVSKSREIYHIEDTKSRETERDKTEKLFIEIEQQTNQEFIKAYKKEEIILKKKRQKYLNDYLRKPFFDRDRSTKELWANIEQFIKICCHVFIWQWLYEHWVYSIRKKHCLYFSIEVWLRIVLVILAYNMTG